MSRILILLGVFYLIFCFAVVFSAWTDSDTNWEYRPEEDDEQEQFIRDWKKEHDKKDK